jgi:hypothetical protein
MINRSNKNKIVIILFGIFCLLPSFGYVAYRLSVPSDGARLSEDQLTFTTEGIVITPFESAGSPFLDGDIVTTIDGIPAETWAGSVFRGSMARPDWAIGDTVQYEVLRGDERVKLTVPLIRLPISEILAGHWGAIAFAFVSQVVAGFVLLRRKNNPAAIALFIWAFSGSHTYAWSVFLHVFDYVGGTGFWIFRGATPLLWLLYWPASTHVALVFPRRFAIVRQQRWLIPGLYLASFAIFAAGLTWSWFRSENVLEWQATWGPIDSLIAGIFLAATMVTISLQYRRARTPQARQQIRLAILGALIAGLGGLIFWIGAPLLTGSNLIDANVLGLLAIPFPLSLALAIWRHQLFDIDVIIRRTLQYSLTTLLLAGLYFIGVVVLQAVFQGILGDADSPLITVLSTLGIASAFNPLRRSVQEFIDRRFFRTRYDAEHILEAFAAAARDEVDLEVLSVALLGVVDETMQPSRISLWISQKT